MSRLRRADDPEIPAVEPALIVGGWVGGESAENERWDPYLDQLWDDLDGLPGNSGAPFTLWVVYNWPGPVLPLEFAGVRRARFSRATNTIRVDVACTEAPPADPRAFLIDALQRAIESVDEWMRRTHRDGDLAVARRLAAQLREL